METEAVKEMFLRWNDGKIQYQINNIYGDGENKTFKAILDINSYGDEVPVKKKGVRWTLREADGNETSNC